MRKEEGKRRGKEKMVDERRRGTVKVNEKVRGAKELRSRRREREGNGGREKEVKEKRRRWRRTLRIDWSSLLSKRDDTCLTLVALRSGREKDEAEETAEGVKPAKWAFRSTFPKEKKRVRMRMGRISRKRRGRRRKRRRKRRRRKRRRRRKSQRGDVNTARKE